MAPIESAQSSNPEYPISSPVMYPTTSTSLSDRGDTKSDLRAERLFRSLIKSNRIWVEKCTPSPSMISQHLAKMGDKHHSLALTLGTSEMATFIASAGGELSNENEFSQLVAAITKQLGDTDPERTVRYYTSGDTIMTSRTDRDPKNVCGLKPDFFTSSIQRNLSTGRDVPLSVSTIISQEIPDMINLNAKSTTLPGNDSDALKNDGLFTWEDVQDIWEVKSSSSDLDKRRWWANLTLKASEVLRFQWHRQFVRGFLVCGTYMRMFFFSRSGVLVSLPVNFQNDDAGGRLTFTKCLLAPLVLSPAATGSTIDHHHPQTVEVDGRPRLIIQVDQKDFVLGDQIVWPQKNHLVSRATTAHLARRMGDQEWGLCYKSSRPYEVRTHESDILNKLQDVEGIVRLVAWDAPSPTCAAPAMSYTHEKFHPCDIQSITKGDQQLEGAPVQVRARQHRQIVTEYIPRCINDRTFSLIELMQIWRSLYLVVDAIAQKGWVHRDLSWTNIRLVRRGASWSATLIDFDLAAPIIGISTGSPDKTGTSIFMPIQILDPPTNIPCRHQELHEDESAFWIGFLVFLSCSNEGLKKCSSLVNQDLVTLAEIKNSMLTLNSYSSKWHDWFDKTAQMDVVRETLAQVAKLQFGHGTWGINNTYPRAEELDDQGRRTHLMVHKGVLAIVVEELEKAIDRLRAIESDNH